MKSLLFRAALLLPLLAPAAVAGPDEAPRAADPRLVVERFAAAPDIVHPVALDFDARGRLLVIESHTHFRPANYQGPTHDRIRVVEDTDGDGRADRFTTFFEGTTATMDLAVHPDGSVYVATRNEILRLRDDDGNGKADGRERLVFLDTKGNYPHNGLSGLCFDARGDLIFGMGENLGADYRLLGADGKALTGGGEGGNVYHCTADGKRLRRVATGFWNPFGAGRDVFGRLFVVDNDADAMPPCRMLHVVEGGDYGYQFRYGRTGRHPFQAWDGQLPGTLPMVTGTGEAPCEVLAYESDGLPTEYVGDLLVTSWADHRVERYQLRERGSSFSAERKPFVQGGADFRPVGLAVAPDGSLFVSDWVLRDYNLHNRGAIWHIRAKEPRRPERPTDPRLGLLSKHRPLREAAARNLAATPEGQRFLRQQRHHSYARVRAASLEALTVAGAMVDLGSIVATEAHPGIRALALSAANARGDAPTALAGLPPEVRRQAIDAISDVDELLRLLTDPDPFLRHAATRRLATAPGLLDRAERRPTDDPARRRLLLLARRESGRTDAAEALPRFLRDPDDEVRFLAAKWVADHKLEVHRLLLDEGLRNPKLSARLFLAYSAALARLDGKDVGESAMGDAFVARLADARTPAALRVLALQTVPPEHKGLKVDLLERLMKDAEPTVRLEALRTLAAHPAPQRLASLRAVAFDATRPEGHRAEAVAGLAERAGELAGELVGLVKDGPAQLRDEALRDLVGVRLNESQRRSLEGAKDAAPQLVDRVLGKPFAMGRPPATDLAAWQKRLEGPADADAGRRVFFHARLAGCYRCHRSEGRGHDIGPDLSTIGRRDRRDILESILRPSNNVAPHYQAWLLTTADGKTRTGMLLRTHLDEYTYVDEKGGQFKVNTRDIVENAPAPKSIMPEGLTEQLTDQELRDLLAYLSERK